MYPLYPHVCLTDPVSPVVQEASSQPGRVVLRRVGFNTSGQYRCEVSAEAPDFNTVTGHGSLMVIEPPTSGPVITGGRTKYHVNETVDLVCTSSPSRPPTHLSWRINGRPAPQGLVTYERPYMAQDGLLTQISRLMFVARPLHFQRGVLRIKCVAEISSNRLTHHHTIPDTFRAWERSFQGYHLNSPAFIPVTWKCKLLWSEEFFGPWEHTQHP
ncbi:uncharacterized protein [Panulirus ornatus]|uniref:uncharacterized protein n=1 Tax=Panulirus ornatus TaxID=150431 RepID=UPI003A83E0E1